MKTTITQRNFKPLYHCLIVLSIFLLIRQYFVVKTSDLTKLVSQLYLTNIELGKLGLQESQQSYEPLYIKIRSFEEYFGVAIVLMSCVIFYFISTYLKSIQAKFIAFLIELSLVWTVFSMTTTEVRLNAREDDEYYISLLVFLPFLFFIYRDTFIGRTDDITEQIKREEEKKKKKKKKKKAFKIKEKIEAEVENSEKYDLLLKAKQKGLLTDDEYKIKFEDLVNSNNHNRINTTGNLMPKLKQ